LSRSVFRPYRSRRRDDAAAATRHAILDAARSVIADRGYAGATIAAIAAMAEVAVPTVYASVGGKAALLLALHALMDQGATLAASREAMRNTWEPRSVIYIAVDFARRASEEFGDLLVASDAAAPFEPAAAEAMRAALQRHRETCRGVATRLAQLGTLRTGLSPEEAADALAVLSGWRTWHALVHDYGWSWQAAADWIAATARRALLGVA
jgi:AcrR family transcriptional regulator